MTAVGTCISVSGSSIVSYANVEALKIAGVSELSDKYIVTIWNGTEFITDIKVSTKAPTIVDLGVYDAATRNYYSDSIDMTQAAGAISASDLLGVVWGEDTYGAYVGLSYGPDVEDAQFADGTPYGLRMTITDLDSDAGAIANNGSATASLSGLATGDTFTVTYTVDGMTYSVMITVQ